ncbi:MAG: hypothetical protein MUF15_17005 [Acidobacteria bacterium]|jgi:hypothetical protein|nr:hypothetical protein [Acidobacteriota bacterium]
MEKNFKLIMDIVVNIPDKIPPELIKQLTQERKIPDYKVKTELHQAFIDYIKTNDFFLEQMIAGNLYYRLIILLDYNLAKYLKFKEFEDTVFEAALQMGPEYAMFIKSIYDSKKDDDEIKREVDRNILIACLLDYELKGASLQIINNES